MKRSNSKRVYSVFIIVGLLTGALVFTACKKSNDNLPNSPVSAVMAFNLAPDKAAIGISFFRQQSCWGANNLYGLYGKLPANLFRHI